mmetsp:Transcript_57518/g.168438  ORF Transcript_57518/g.168438 Transcript_57518/m.168438 type:complete len:345 (+) Transcript_57518:106-1140(+)
MRKRKTGWVSYTATHCRAPVPSLRCWLPAWLVLLEVAGIAGERDPGIPLGQIGVLEVTANAHLHGSGEQLEDVDEASLGRTAQLGADLAETRRLAALIRRELRRATLQVGNLQHRLSRGHGAARAKQQEPADTSDPFSMGPGGSNVEAASQHFTDLNDAIKRGDVQSVREISVKAKKEVEMLLAKDHPDTTSSEGSKSMEFPEDLQLDAHKAQDEAPRESHHPAKPTGKATAFPDAVKACDVKEGQDTEALLEKLRTCADTLDSVAEEAEQSRIKSLKLNVEMAKKLRQVLNSLKTEEGLPRMKKALMQDQTRALKFFAGETDKSDKDAEELRGPRPTAERAGT